MTQKNLILCVDDDPFYCEFYTTIFTTKGYKIVVAQDLESGFKKAKEVVPTLVILDVMMPEKGGFFDGYDLLAAIKEDNNLHDIPIVMISALDQTGDARHATESGADDYIPKQDLTPDKLFQTVEKLLS